MCFTGQNKEEHALACPLREKIERKSHVTGRPVNVHKSRRADTHILERTRQYRGTPKTGGQGQGSQIRFQVDRFCVPLGERLVG